MEDPILRTSCRLVLIASLTYGCSSFFGHEEPDVSISLSGELERVSAFEVDLGRRSFRLEPEDAESRRNVRAPDTGDLPVRVELLGTTVDTLAVAEFTQTFHENSDHWVVGRVGMRRPIGHCIGHLDVIALPEISTGTVPDTLFLTHGSIPKDAVC